MRGVQVQLCKTEDAMWKTCIVKKDANGCRFHPPLIHATHFPVLVRGTNEELGGRFWRSMPQDVLIRHGNPFPPCCGGAALFEFSHLQCLFPLP
ncbi:hypothetical protein CDAR_414741 [Caerostris darwini]|uniref:Uncharacterized protein n=1 Tax=Caerostris darwini TaxID=1538125 RepID=A0AAV4RDI6_9ARAC|nr:hypothetical protein CDAR_414741 [Caerostris darwini]